MLLLAVLGALAACAGRPAPAPAPAPGPGPAPVSAPATVAAPAVAPEPPLPSPPPGPPGDPQAIAMLERDLTALHQILLADHPGAVDPRNPSVRAEIEAGYAEARALAPRVRDRAGYVAVLRRYLARFRDGHVALQVKALPGAWPGFTVALRGERYVVHESSPGAPPVGSIVTACDGEPLPARMRRDVFAYHGDPALEASWVRFAPYVLADTGNPFVARPRRCEIADPNPGAARRIVELAWAPLDADALYTRLIAAAFGPAPPVGVRRLADGTVWATLPTFGNPFVVRPVIADAASWRAAPRIVLDVRGNSGGSSQYGVDLANELWGAAFVAEASRRAAIGRPPITVDWRTSPAVQAHVESLAVVYPPARDIARKIGEARAAGRLFFSETDAVGPPPAGPPPQPATRARVVLLTDGSCASACLDFADLLLRDLPGVVHAGLPTSADTEYMEIRPVSLPSGVTVVLPTKIWRNRPRGREPYVPRHRFAGDIRDTAALEAWIRTLPL